MSDYQVVWQGIVHDSQGYARASREYLLALDRLGVDVKVEPLNFGTPSVALDAEQASKIKELVAKPYAEDKKKVLIYHAQPYGVDANKERQKFDHVIINTVWETTKVPDNWFPHVNYADAVIVPSTQNVQALKDSGVTPHIIYAPHGADTVTYNPDNEPLPLKLGDKFTFLSVFQWQHRKGPDILFKAFWQEFTSKDNVVMVVKTFLGNTAPRSDQMQILNVLNQYKQYLKIADSADVFVTPSVFDDANMRSLYTMADAFVLPSRGEGVGLPYIEAMSSGVPCIATGWGGQTDFINERNGYLIDYNMAGVNEVQGVAPHFSNLFTPEMMWAEPDVGALRFQMRMAYENQAENAAKGKQARIDMENMTWEKTAGQIKAYLDTVFGGN